MLTASAAAIPALAQESKMLLETVSGNQDIFAYDFGPPASPALTLLGSDSAGLTPATSLKAFVVSAGNTLQGGAAVAIEISPAALFGKINNFDSYQSSRIYRLVRRSKLGFAVLNGRSGAEAVRSGVSLGLSMSLLDGSDPLRTRGGNKAIGEQGLLMSCLARAYGEIVNAKPVFDREMATGVGMLPGDLANDKALEGQQGTLVVAKISGNFVAAYQSAYDVLKAADEAAAKALTAPNPGISASDVQALIDAIYKKRAEYRLKYNALFEQRVQQSQADFDKCAIKASRLASFSMDLDVGVGWVWRGKPGELSDLRSGGGAIWAAFQFPLPGSLQVDEKTDLKSVWMLGASGKYALRETIQTGNAVTTEIRADTLNLWAGIERQSEDLLFSARYGYQQIRANDPIGRFFNRSGSRFLLQAQYRLGKGAGTWLGLSYGNANGSVDTFNAKRLQINLSFSPPAPDNITGIKN